MGVALASVAASVGAVVILAPVAAAATTDQVTGTPTVSTVVTVSAAQPDPMFFGMGAVGLFWLLAGLLALAAGLVLATRRARTSNVGLTAGSPTAGSPTSDGPAGAAAAAAVESRPPSNPNTHQTTSNNEPGGARK
jgi:hypothetical protein